MPTITIKGKEIRRGQILKMHGGTTTVRVEEISRVSRRYRSGTWAAAGTGWTGRSRYSWSATSTPSEPPASVPAPGTTRGRNLSRRGYVIASYRPLQWEYSEPAAYLPRLHDERH